ncbi:MAG: disulfide bond formation protein B [Nanoarchaeota archaeon]
MPTAIIIPEIFAFLTLLGDIFIVLLIISLLVKISFIEDLKNSLRKNSLLLAFMISLMASLGTLFYSEILGYAPCTLCWIQRAFMYPIPVILGVALLNKNSGVKKHAIFLATIGALIAAYHYVVQMFQLSTICGANSEIPCNVAYAIELGYITIPMMSLTAFALIIILMLKKI